MSAHRVAVAVLAAALLMAGCGDDGDSAEPPTTTSPTSTSPTTTAPTTTEPTTTSTTTTEPTTTSTTTRPAPECDPDDVYGTVDAALAEARLEPGAPWSTDDASASRYEERTTTGDEFAARLGLDCGVVAAQTTAAGADRLLIAAWTGPRSAFVVQASDGPSEPYAPEAVVRTRIEDVSGEYLHDDQSLWAATLGTGETFLVGHVDYNLGAAAKDWVDEERDFLEDVTLDSERHAIAALETAGMRNVGIAQPPEIGSEEGYVQFVSVTGQISVADVAPAGWFDPMTPRYYTGPTRTVTVDGTDVRITEPDPDDNAGFTIAAEVAFACDDFVWILEPPFNGTADEMLASATAVIGTPECHADRAG